MTGKEGTSAAGFQPNEKVTYLDDTNTPQDAVFVGVDGAKAILRREIRNRVFQGTVLLNRVSLRQANDDVISEPRSLGSTAGTVEVGVY